MRAVSVIIPCFNNEGSIEELVGRINIQAKSLRDYVTLEVVLVDDGSSDGTWKEISRQSSRYSHVVGIRLSRNFGQHPAIKAAMTVATGEIVVLMDADLQDKPEYIPLLLGSIEAGHDLVLTRWNSETIRPRVTSKVFHELWKAKSSHQIPRNVGTFRAFNRKVRDALLEYGETSIVYGPLMSQIGFNVHVVDVERDLAQGRRTSYSIGKRLRLSVNALLGYSEKPFIAMAAIGSLLMTASGLLLMATVIDYLAGDNTLPSGITFLICLNLGTVGSLFFFLGLVLLYQYKTFIESLNRPLFHVMETTR